MDELTVQRSITTAYIASAPVELVLTPVIEVKSGNGTTANPGVPRAPQIVKVNEPGDSNRREPQLAGDGVQRRHDYVVIAEHDAVIEVGDLCTLYGHECEVIELLTPNGYETRALVMRRGH